MDRQLKERLVGALVLVVLAIILIPTVLDGPDETRQTQTLDLPPVEGQETDAPMQSYSFDLNGAENPEPAISTPPVESEQQAQQAIIDASPVTKRNTDQTKEQTAPEPQSAQPATADNNQSTTNTASEPENTPPPKPAPQPEGATQEGEWAVQVGSFSKQELAQRLADELEIQGYPVFLMEFTTGGVTYHRVRVGPFGTENEAQKTASKLRQKTSNPAKVVSN